MAQRLDYLDFGPRVCPRCGVRCEGQHETAIDCIDALRGIIAEMQFRNDRAADKEPAPRQTSACRGGQRDRSDARMVVLDGDRITLTEAGRRLGISGSALHFRIVRRTGTDKYGEVDLRAIRVEVKRTPVDSSRQRVANARARLQAEMAAL